MIQDLHVHSCFCDGKDEPEEIVKSAIDKGIGKLGIVTHSYTFFDRSYCIPEDKVKTFIETINVLKEKYSDEITVLCGVEQDYYSDHPTDGFDYVIGSVHYLKRNGIYYPIDESREAFLKMVREGFSGDFNAMAEKYYSLESDVVKKTGADIIGHFDLITKFNEGDCLFDTGCERYVEAWKGAVDRLLQHDVPFEINTGAISRGYRKTPYPAPDMIEYIKQKKGRLMLSSDAHSKDTLSYHFEDFGYLMK